MFGWEFPPYHSGGLGVACLGLTRALSNLGLSVIFVMPKKMNVSAPWTRLLFAEEDNVDVRTIPSRLRAYAEASKATEGGLYGRDLIEEVGRYSQIGGALAKTEQFDVIYAHDWLSFGAGLEAKRLSGKPLIVHVHATEFDRCGGRDGINREVYDLEREGMQGADVIIAVSELTKHIIVQEYGIPAEKVHVVYNGIDEVTAPSKGDALPRLRVLRHSGYKLVLFLGRVTLQKGPDYFLRAAKRVLERNPKVIFILSGSGDMDSQVMQLAGELGIAGHVLFTGFLHGAERHEVYECSDLFVMPSVSEPFGITALEAMKIGTPVLISKQSGVAEVVHHALKADFWDVDEMANKILSVVGYPSLRLALAENAAAEAKRLTWSDAARKIGTLVHELVE